MRLSSCRLLPVSLLLLAIAGVSLVESKTQYSYSGIKGVRIRGSLARNLGEKNKNKVSQNS